MPYSLSGDGGKNRATRQKAVALAKEISSLTVLYPKSENLALRGGEVILNELKVMWLLSMQKSRPDFLLTRGLAGILSVHFARLIKVKTLREVHSVPTQEAWQMRARFVKRLTVSIIGLFDNLVSRISDIRIFNHPQLKDYFMDKGWLDAGDFFCYNGGALEDASNITKSQARIEFGLPLEKKVLVFVGSAASWHGIDHLLSLSIEFEKKGKDILIVCGGGDVSSIDSGNRLINLTPLNSQNAAKLIRAADACLLPVADIRISPGSPLKLYDYVLNHRPVISQNNILGYEDEVMRLGVGIAVDFSYSEQAAVQITEFLSSEFEMPPLRELAEIVSWKSRIKFWLDAAFCA